MGNRRLRRKQGKKEIAAAKALNRNCIVIKDAEPDERTKRIFNGLLSELARREEPVQKTYSGGPLGRSYRPLWRLWPVRSRHGARKQRFMVVNSSGEIITQTSRAGLQEWVIEGGVVKPPARRTRLTGNKRRAG